MIIFGSRVPHFRTSSPNLRRLCATRTFGHAAEKERVGGKKALRLRRPALKLARGAGPEPPAQALRVAADRTPSRFGVDPPRLREASASVFPSRSPASGVEVHPATAHRPDPHALMDPRGTAHPTPKVGYKPAEQNREDMRPFSEMSTWYDPWTCDPG